jgi:hypothetical protein
VIELRDLSVVLEQRGERMWADVAYRFYNPEHEQNLTVGFMTLPHIPADRQLDTRLEPNLVDLVAEVNGKPVGFTVKSIIETEFQQELKGITDLSFVYFASIRFRRGENDLRVSYGFSSSRDSTGVLGLVYYPFTVTPAALWANRRVNTFSLRIEMEPGTLITVPRNLGSPAAPNPWRLVGQGKMSRSDSTEDSNDELLYVYLKNSFLELEMEDYRFERDLVIQIYKPFAHLEPLKSMYWLVFKGRGLEQYTAEDLRIARNTLFAFHGYKFPRQDLLEYFSRYFWYDPNPNVLDSSEILSGEERTLLRYITEQEKIPEQKVDVVRSFLERFRSAVLDRHWQEALTYLDPAYIEDQLQDRFNGDETKFLTQLFGGIDPDRIVDLEFVSFPESVAKGKVVARFDLKVLSSTVEQTLKFQIHRSGDEFLLFGPHDGVTIFSHKSFPVRDASRILVRMRSIGDGYLRCYSTWIGDGSGGYINLEGADCTPEQWRSDHCSCPTVSQSKEVRYDLINYTDTPYTGDVTVAVSSYVGYWQVEVETDTGAPKSPISWQQGRSWSTPTDSTQHHAEVKGIRYWIADRVLRGEASFLGWNRTGCPACIQQIVLISDRKTGGLYDAVCINLGIPGVFPGKQIRRSFEIPFPRRNTKIWAFSALQYNCDDAISLARQNFLIYKEENKPIIGD